MESFEDFAAGWIKAHPSRAARYGATLAEMSDDTIAMIRRYYHLEIESEARDAAMVEADARAEAEAERKDAERAERREALQTLAERVCVALGSTCTFSQLSDSTYIEATGRKIRISDHPLPPTYGALNGYADIEVAVGYRDGDSHVILDRFDDDAIDAAAAKIIALAKI